MRGVNEARKEAGCRKAPGVVPAFPYFLVLLVSEKDNSIRILNNF
jgi:hypothetical protein